MCNAASAASGRPHARRCGVWAAVAISVLAWLTVLTPATASAQLINPSRVTWTATLPDHSETLRYELGWYLTDTAPAPVLVVDLGKPIDPECVIAAPSVTCSVLLPQRPALGSWVVRIQAVGQDYQGQPAPSGWSAPSNPFSCSLRVPGTVGATP